jgi:phosphotransferase system enzyme I (PtsI)
MEIIKGIGVSPGVVIFPAVVLDAEDLIIPRRVIDASLVESESARLHAAVAKAQGELASLRAGLVSSHGKEIASIFDFHAGLLKDKTLVSSIENEIKHHLSNAEYAVSVSMRKLANTFLQMKDTYLSDRVKDIYDIEKRLLRTLIGNKHEDLLHLNVQRRRDCPRPAAEPDGGAGQRARRGFACDVGGRTSHTAIVARAMGIPAVVGLGNVTSSVSGGDTIIIDGTRGMVIVNPDDDQLREHEELVRQQVKIDADLAAMGPLAAETRDGNAVSLMANIEFPAEIDEAVFKGRRRHRAVPDRVPVHGQPDRADRGRPLHRLRRRRPAASRASL